MAQRVIDYNRGVIKRDHPDTGVEVYMYKDQPGVFLNAFGKEVSDAVAKAAGFDVDRLGKEKLKKERMAQAMHAIETELDQQPTGEEKVLATQGGFKIIDMGLERGHVKDDDGNILTPVPVPLAFAKSLLDQLAPPSPKAPTEAAKDVDVGEEIKGTKAPVVPGQKETKDGSAKA